MLLSLADTVIAAFVITTTTDGGTGATAAFHMRAGVTTQIRIAEEVSRAGKNETGVIVGRALGVSAAGNVIIALIVPLTIDEDTLILSVAFVMLGIGDDASVDGVTSIATFPGNIFADAIDTFRVGTAISINGAVICSRFIDGHASVVFTDATLRAAAI